MVQRAQLRDREADAEDKEQHAERAAIEVLVGAVLVQRPQLRDREADAEDKELHEERVGVEVVVVCVLVHRPKQQHHGQQTRG